MKNENEFIKRVSDKMGYSNDGYTVIEKDETDYEINDNGITFVIGSCIDGNTSNEIVKEYNLSKDYKVMTFDKWEGISIIAPFSCESGEGLNIQGLGTINSFLTLLLAKPVIEEEELIENISLKEYYKLNLPDNRIGRKSDETLIKELEEAGFKV